MSEQAKTVTIKSIHYVTLIGLFILIIPAGLNSVFFYVGMILFGINMGVNVIDSSLSKKKIFATLAISFALILFGLFKLLY
ncbi:hypothetical protein BK049_10040 [Bacillus xiamenensis]|uniref:Uncharacterized protein n=1 Tax=Bacillus xiamenensis TaxID=1178537 RepID=A0AAC9NCP8_9BACI|nr:MULTISPECIES: hypothetical protein [Bacillus]AOZ88989.1 hypothetical protein BK049_10040 [Bacillus xiamenensis]EKF37318.1 hypothetical protein BA1_01665 [Bacillus xiamenensis]MBG9910287.1 hypothetical protein [Bacillus xiamenensis]MCW1834920.1 hypothetical protein [Bacillus xiamenensis]MCY9575077.1 hypothetical protein [Bacillus xiamenensis]